MKIHLLLLLSHKISAFFQRENFFFKFTQNYFCKSFFFFPDCVKTFHRPYSNLVTRKGVFNKDGLRVSSQTENKILLLT